MYSNGFWRKSSNYNPSNLIIQRRYYSNTIHKDNNLISNNSTLINEPWFITGFADAEGSFIIVSRKTLKSKLIKRYYSTINEKLAMAQEGLQIY